MTAMVLPALFAACTSEELDVVNNVESLNSRAEVENVTLTVGETVDSRLVYDGGYTFQAGDQLGAALMDDITADYGDPTKTWGQWFNLIDYIHTNYKFTRDAEGNWETEAKLCEGNYFFAYPYNMNQGLREAYAFSCEDQVLEGTDAASLKKAYVENNSFVGYGKVVRSNEEGESVAVPMVPVFGATGIILTNRGTEERTIEKIVLRGDKVTTLAVVNPSASNENQKQFDVDTYAANLKKGTAAALKANDEALAGIIEYSTPENSFIEVYIKSGNTISDGESINVIVMSGLAEIAEGEVMMDVYSTRGVIRDIDLAKVYTAKDEDDIVTDNVLTALGAGKKVEVEFSHSTFEVENALDVYSDDDLAELIKWNAEAKTEREITATLKADVTLTKAMYDKLVSTKMITKATIDGTAGMELTIAKDVPADAIDKLNLVGGRVMILGEQTVAGTNTMNAKLQVAKGAVLTLKRNLPTRNHVNYGTLNLAAKLSITNQVYNYGGEINVTAAATIGTLENHEGTINNKSTLTIAAGKNNGVINNDGTLDAAAFVNAVKETTDCTSCNVKHAAGTVKNAGKILALTNNSLVEMLSAEARATVTGDGQIDNTIQSSYVTGGDNTIFVKVADLKASELAEIIVNAGATKVKVSGTITVDPAEGETTVSLKDNLTIEATAKLTIAGKGKLYAKKANLEIAKNVEVLIKNGASLSIDGGSAKAIAAPAYLTIENGGKFYGTVETDVTVEDYSK